MEGLDEVMRNLNREIKEVKGNTLAGLYKGGLRIQRDAQQMTPVLTGNLKASAYTRKALQSTPNGDAVPPETVQVGYGAAYALPVHENLEARHTNGEAKFLEKSVNQNRGQVLRDVKEKARV